MKNRISDHDLCDLAFIKSVINISEHIKETKIFFLITDTHLPQFRATVNRDSNEGARLRSISDFPPLDLGEIFQQKHSRKANGSREHSLRSDRLDFLLETIGAIYVI